ncbi:hypothetical protein RT723_00815 [Psychrosphaera aquimarina]|uniref:Uncharacterized protein n=1 Tax=Psychrosphaera aquimarina TaxID=2044854 RepID=A0ABU3QVV4_9GAMM|nr:hypothetical protein [Psychrosphaera aquimarina]MDU0111571.1 hypothetical protein [Psychrosphaera aquimarina]
MNNELAIQVDSGDAKWLGVNKKDGGFNFAVYAPDAKRLFIHFFYQIRKSLSPVSKPITVPVTYSIAISLVLMKLGFTHYK